MFDAAVKQTIDRVDALRDQVDDHWQVPRDEAELLAALVLASQSTCICEIGTSYGFSTLHLAAATRQLGGHVHTIDISEKKRDAAARHFADANLGDRITQHLGDARDVLANLSLTDPFDFVFIDAVKQQSFEYLDAVTPKLATRAVIITDNTVTHEKELASFVAHLRALPNAISCGIPVGNGVEMTVVTPNAP